MQFWKSLTPTTLQVIGLRVKQPQTHIEAEERHLCVIAPSWSFSVCILEGLFMLSCHFGRNLSALSQSEEERITSTKLSWLSGYGKSEPTASYTITENSLFQILILKFILPSPCVRLGERGV